jgi:hypothetical protein
MNGMADLVLARGARRGSSRAAAILAALAAALASRAALADETAPVRPVSPCALRGAQALPKGTTLFDAPAGGRPIATFTGAVVAMRASELPIGADAGRARIATSNGAPSLRLEGYAAIDALTVYPTRDVPVFEGRVWLAAGFEAKLAAAAADTVTIERVLLGTAGQKARATAPCDALSLDPVAKAPAEPGSSRGYMTRGSTLDLYDGPPPKGDVVFSLRMIEGAGQLLWGTTMQGGFVRVTARSDLAVDAWVRLRDLEPLKKGELVDQLAAPTRVVEGATLAFDSPPRVAKAPRDIPVRARRDENERPIGVVEAGAEVYVLETVAGFTHVLPKALGLVPPDGGGFWILASETPP